MAINKIGSNVKTPKSQETAKGPKKDNIKSEKLPEVKLKKPLDKDTFEKKQPVDKEGKIVNKNGVINN